uniref:DUF8204 domain-containing protein n=1 Tax=Leersia perrieri TaxID=77586 RepID=A0A0D9XFY8_9ORYZ
MGEESPVSGGGGAAPPRGKSCKGCLYYSSLLKSRGFNPVCVGIPRSISQVPNHVVDDTREQAAEAAAQGYDWTQFKFACVGYSMFVVDNKKDGESGDKEGETFMPFCQGFELLVGRRIVQKNSRNDEQATGSYRKEAPTSSRQQGQRPGQLTQQDFSTRKAGFQNFPSCPFLMIILLMFRKSAGLVASGVAKNLNKTANYIKANIVDILYSDRRPPK